jgi:predicted dehydrogenase
VRQIAIFGCGRISLEAWAPVLERLSDCVQVQTLIDPSEERRRELQKALPSHPAGIWSANEGWAKRIDPEALVLVLTPPRQAVHVVAQAQAEGLRDFLVEKPFAWLPSDRQFLKAAVLPATSISVTDNYLHRPDFALALSLVRDGAIGRVLWGRLQTLARGHWRGASATTDPDWRRSAADNPGGVIADKGYHLVYLAEALGGSKLTSLRSVVRGDPACPSHWFAVGTDNHGAAWSLTASWDQGDWEDDALSLVGTAGSIRIPAKVGDPIEVVSNGVQRQHSVDGDWWGVEGTLVRALQGTNNFADHERRIHLIQCGLLADAVGF